MDDRETAIACVGLAQERHGLAWSRLAFDDQLKILTEVRKAAAGRTKPPEDDPSGSRPRPAASSTSAASGPSCPGEERTQ
jgi:hypothetical protein